MGALVVVILILVFVGLFLAFFVKIAREYERGVIFRLGRLLGVKGPGMFILIPLVDRFVRVDLRTVTLAVPPQEVITRDNVTVKVTAVAYFRVVDAAKAVVQVENYLVATSQIAQTTLRSVLGQVDLDHLLSEREPINDRLQTIIDHQTAPWGVKVSVVEVKDVELPQTMQRALARQAEAERERRAKIIAAEGELQASEKLSQAANVIASEPTALQLRYLQTLTEIASERTSTLIVPVPLDLFEPFLEARRRAAIRDGATGSRASAS
jgi:regulator of protease activity HflC (stomatin/prohibitin superfamily)